MHKTELTHASIQIEKSRYSGLDSLYLTRRSDIAYVELWVFMTFQKEERAKQERWLEKTNYYM
jgi:hypothetical protein